METRRVFVTVPVDFSSSSNALIADFLTTRGLMWNSGTAGCRLRHGASTAPQFHMKPLDHYSSITRRYWSNGPQRLVIGRSRPEG
jgi:hypothetical protein